MEISAGKSKRVISIFVLAMLNVSVMASLRSLPLVAEFGYSSIFFFLVVALTFLLPQALVAAELATGWPKSGGIYIWVREALGDRWGFFAIWIQWVHNVTWYPVILSFCATTFAYVFYPPFIENKYYVLAVIVLSFWGMTFFNFTGIRLSSWFSTFCVIAGTILPGLFLIGLGLSWVISGQPLQIHFTYDSFVPDFSRIDNIVFLGGLFLSFAGLEVTSGYAGEVQNPQRNYPIAILMAALITFFLFLLGSLSIAWVIPKSEIDLASGLMAALKIFLENYNLTWLLGILGVLLIAGAIGETNAWIIGPVKGLYTTSRHGNLPPIFQKLNKNQIPVNLLYFQAIIVTFASFMYLLMPSISSAFWILTALSAQIYLVMYVMMFIAAIRLRYTRPNVPRAYQIPHPHKGMWLIASIGIVTSIFGILLVLIPPAQFKEQSIITYVTFLLTGLTSMVALPLIIHAFKKPSWNPVERVLDHDDDNL
ncbi:MAG: amino acid permease [Chlamydiia bacterium]